MTNFEHPTFPQTDIPNHEVDPPNTDSTPEVVSAEAFSVLDDEAKNATDSYTHKFRRPFSYMGKTFVELHFDWDSLDGQDSLDISNELQARGITVIVKTMSDPYLMCMAAKACTTEQIGSDAFALMKLKDFNKILGAARAFLHAAE